MRKTTLNNTGFTLVELLIVISLLLLFVVSFGIMNSQSFFLGNQQIYNSYTDIDFSVNGAWRKASAGYGASLVSKTGIKNDKNRLPEDYIVFFQKSNENNNIGGKYFEIQTQTRTDSSGSKYTRVINSNEKSVKSPAIYLKRILGKNAESDIGTELNSIAIAFKNPTGKQSFYVNDDDFIKIGNKVLSEDLDNTLNEFIVKTPSTLYKIIELEYYGTDDKKKYTYKMFDNKVFYTDLTK